MAAKPSLWWHSVAVLALYWLMASAAWLGYRLFVGLFHG